MDYWTMCAGSAGGPEQKKQIILSPGLNPAALATADTELAVSWKRHYGLWPQTPGHLFAGPTAITAPAAWHSASSLLNAHYDRILDPYEADNDNHHGQGYVTYPWTRANREPLLSPWKARTAYYAWDVQCTTEGSWPDQIMVESTNWTRSACNSLL